MRLWSASMAFWGNENRPSPRSASGTPASAAPWSRSSTLPNGSLSSLATASASNVALQTDPARSTPSSYHDPSKRDL
jgi:hypothetical protein